LARNPLPSSPPLAAAEGPPFPHPNHQTMDKDFHAGCTLAATPVRQEPRVLKLILPSPMPVGPRNKSPFLSDFLPLSFPESSSTEQLSLVSYMAPPDFCFRSGLTTPFSFVRASFVLPSELYRCDPPRPTTCLILLSPFVPFIGLFPRFIPFLQRHTPSGFLHSSKPVCLKRLHPRSFSLLFSCCDFSFSRSFRV